MNGTRLLAVCCAVILSTTLCPQPLAAEDENKLGGPEESRDEAQEICYAIPECGQRCSRYFQDGEDFRVKYVEVYLLHNGIVVGRSGQIPQDDMKLADYRSDLSDAAEEAIIDSEMDDLDPRDNYSPSAVEVFHEMTTDLSSVFPEVEREDGRVSTIVTDYQKCKVPGCTCVWRGDPQDRDDRSRRSRVLTFQRIVPVGDGEYTYQIVWTVTFTGWDRRWQWGTCKLIF